MTRKVVTILVRPICMPYETKELLTADSTSRAVYYYYHNYYYYYYYYYFYYMDKSKDIIRSIKIRTNLFKRIEG